VCAAMKASVNIVGGGCVRSPLPDASKSLGLFHVGRNILNLSPLLAHDRNLTQVYNSDILYETRSR
jgi:hypothetical protein